MNINTHPIYNKYLKFKKQEKDFDNISLPLCASENIISPFCSIPLQDITHEKYLLGGTLEFSQNGNFVGSDILYNIYKLINEQTKRLFNCKYSDARTLSGLNCITSLLMAITNIGDTILLSTVESGGHSSMEKIAKRLGLKIIDVPYDFNKCDYDYNKINQILNTQDVKLMLLSPSNLIYEPKLNKINSKDSIIIYDASQTLGMIASKSLSNPLEANENIICVGSTHKTIPGPTSGLIMTNNLEFAKIMDEKINPSFVSSTQLQNKIVLLHSLIELEIIGVEYSNKIQENVKYLSEKFLQSKNYSLVWNGIDFSETHQILLGVDENIVNIIERNSIIHNITLNLSEKRNKLFNGKSGLRIGLQEISRFNWGKKELDELAEIFNLISVETSSNILSDKIRKLTNNKKIHFTV